MSPISSRAFARAAALALLLATAIPLLSYAALQAYAGTGLPRDTRIADVEVGGLSDDEAIARVEERFAPLASGVFRIRVDGRLHALRLGPVISVDAAQSVAAVHARRWNPLTLLPLLRGVSVQPVLRTDSEQLRAAITAFSRRVGVPPQDATIDMTSGEPVIVPARAGRVLDVDRTITAIEQSVLQGRAQTVVRLQPAPAVITTLVAQRAVRDIALPALAEPVSVEVTLDDGSVRSASISTDTIRAALSFQPDGSLLRPVLDGNVLRRDVDPSLVDVQRFAKRAKFRPQADTISVVPGVDGYAIPSAELARQVLEVLRLQGPERTVRPRLTVVSSGITAAELEALGVTELVSSYTQDFPAAAYRTQNIGTAARYINGTILKPGETFSMNDTVKERTVENGYTEGWIIGRDGVFKMEQGGAVSTITTAMFNAAWFAGLKLVEHRAHSIYISRYPAGREATVSWGSFDMRFRNNLSHPILITTRLRTTSITVYFWGTKEWEEIGSEFGPWTSQTPYREIVSTDPECHDQEGMPGFRITVWRTFFRDGVEVKREPYTTSYRPSPHVVCQAPPPTDAPTPTPTG